MRCSGSIVESFLERERVFLSRISGDPTVGGLRGKKEKRSTQSKLRMDPGFTSFDKLQGVGVSPYLCFILILSVFRCFSWLEALNGCLIGPKA